MCSFDDVADGGHVVAGLGVSSRQVHESVTRAPLLTGAPTAIALAWDHVPARHGCALGARIASTSVLAGVECRLHGHAGQLVLVRPDGYVALAGTTGRFAALMERYNAALMS